MICKRCKKEFDETLARCPHCGRRNRKVANDFDPSEYYQGELDLRLLTVTHGERELQVRVAALEAAGVRTMVKRPDGGGYILAMLGFSFMTGEIYVLAEQLEEARAVLKAMDEYKEEGLSPEEEQAALPEGEEE